MRELDNYPRPWRTTTTPRAHKTGGGHNYHIRAANGMYVAERLMGGEDVAALIVESVNERKESIASLRTQLATMAELNNSQREILHAVAVQRDEAVARAEAAERERDGFQAWANTLESCAWQDAGFCPHCGADDVRKSVDVLEPDVAKEIRYCCSCGTAWAVKDAAQPRA